MIRVISVSVATVVLLGACSATSSRGGPAGTPQLPTTTIEPVTSLPPVTVATTTTASTTTTTVLAAEVPGLTTVPAHGDVVDRYAFDFVGSTDPEADVIVNGEPVEVDADGGFAAPVVSDLGMNIVTVVLDNGSGLTATHRVRYQFEPSDGWITAIGDSVMLGAAPEIEKRLGGDVVDATVSRQFLAAPALVERLVDGPVPPQVIIVGLGTNGPAQVQHFDQVMEAAGSDRLMVFVNVRMPRTWEGASNRTIAEGVERYGNAVLVDWYSTTRDRDDLFAADGLHPKQAGRVIMAELIAEAIFPNWVSPDASRSATACERRACRLS